MDLYEAIRALHEEKKKIDRLIAVLEELERTADKDRPAPRKKRRGRKSMSPEERRQVSERMKRYWAQRKQQLQTLSAGQGAAENAHLEGAGG
ncbi:MAG: hypothetical protein ACPL7M_14145 [Bryobacteraceae bacterium]